MKAKSVAEEGFVYLVNALPRVILIRLLSNTTVVLAVIPIEHGQSADVYKSLVITNLGDALQLHVKIYTTARDAIELPLCN